MCLLLNYILWVLFIHVCFVFFLVILCSCGVMLKKRSWSYFCYAGDIHLSPISNTKNRTPLLQWRQTNCAHVPSIRLKFIHSFMNQTLYLIVLWYSHSVWITSSGKYKHQIIIVLPWSTARDTPLHQQWMTCHETDVPWPNRKKKQSQIRIFHHWANVLNMLHQRQNKTNSIRVRAQFVKYSECHYLLCMCINLKNLKYSGRQ